MSKLAKTKIEGKSVTVQAIDKAAALSKANATPSFEERYDNYEERYNSSELFADNVIASADDLSEITASTVNEAAITVDLTTTNTLTDFNKIDTEALTAITQNNKIKK